MNPIIIEQCTHGYKVSYGDLWEDSLCRDEALGVVASILYQYQGQNFVPYLKNAAAHFAWNSQFRNSDPIGEPTKISSPGPSSGIVSEVKSNS